MEVSGETPERMSGRQYASGAESQGLATGDKSLAGKTPHFAGSPLGEGWTRC
jgi:hypothetical protein